MRHVEHPERDFVPVAVPLLQFDWYRHDLHKLYPEAVPEVASDDVQAAMEAIIEHNPGGVYFTFNPLFASERFAVERLDKVWKVILPAGR